MSNITELNLNFAGVQESVLESTYNNVGEGFKKILDTLDDVNMRGGSITFKDTFALQEATFHYVMYQEMVTKIASKSAAGINDVMKAQ